MNVMMIRAKIKAENVAAAQAATEKVLQALEQAPPGRCPVRREHAQRRRHPRRIPGTRARSGASPAHVSRVPGAHRKSQGMGRGAAGRGADDRHRLVSAVLSLGDVTAKWLELSRRNGVADRRGTQNHSRVRNSRHHRVLLLGGRRHSGHHPAGGYRALGRRRRTQCQALALRPGRRLHLIASAPRSRRRPGEGATARYAFKVGLPG